MQWMILIICIVLYILYKFFKDRDQMLNRQVDMRGGMSNKYKYLVNELTSYPNSRVIKVTRDHIQIKSEGEATIMNFLITESFNRVHIEFIGQLGIFGTHKKKWEFSHNYPQDKICEEISNYIEWKVKQGFGF